MSTRPTVEFNDAGGYMAINGTHYAYELFDFLAKPDGRLARFTMDRGIVTIEISEHFVDRREVSDAR
jgi:hypothetical protein